LEAKPDSDIVTLLPIAVPTAPPLAPVLKANRQSRIAKTPFLAT
jgi:hypothetical protein